MTPAEVRWRCARMDHLLTYTSRMEAFTQVSAEARTAPWRGDPRPALPLSTGTIHDGPLAIQDYLVTTPQRQPAPRGKRTKKMLPSWHPSIK